MTPPNQSSSLDPRVRPIERFLGSAEASGGPFALLGVSPMACTDELVLSGLDRQVERINRHPECDTPEADEVRLAVHAAAAQLLGPVVRRHLVSRWGGKPAAVAGAAAAPTPRTADVKPAGMRDGQRLLEADAILTLGLYGGWNQRALRRLVSLAHRRGLSNRQVAETLQNLSRRKVSRRTASEPSSPARRPTTRLQAVAPARVPSPSVSSSPAPVDPAQRVLKNAIIFGIVGMAGLGAAVIGIIFATRTPAVTPAPAPPPVAPPTVTAPPPGQEPAPVAEAAKPARKVPPPPDVKDIAGVPRAIAACTEGLAIDPEAALAQLDKVVATLAAHWTVVPKDNLVAAHDALVEFLYRCGPSTGIPERAVAAIARHAGGMEAGSSADPSEVAPSVWSVGMLARLGRERDLTATAKNAIDASLAVVMGPARAAMEPSFESGAAAAINAWPARLTPATGQTGSPEAWRAWAMCAAGLGGQDSASVQRFLLAGLETLLVQGPEPNANREAAGAIAELTSRLTWRAQDDSRRWLMRWFMDSRVSAADLNAVTSTMATKSGAEGVDLTMVLSTAAAENTRAELRERYATIWGVQESLARDEQITEWAAQARAAINSSFVSVSEADDFAAAVVLARLNDAAWWQWRGDSGEAMRVLSDVRGPVDAAMTLSTREKLEEQPTDLSDGAWAERYLAARNAPKVRREMIAQVVAGDSIGPTDAEVLVGEAFVGSPQDIRNAAQEAVKKFADSATILNAMLERLPRAARTAAMSELISVVAGRPLPGFREPEWPFAARRAIVERLLEALAAESPRVRIDRLSVLLAASYRSMAATSPIPPDQRAVKNQPSAHSMAGEVWRRWRSAADTLVPSTPPPIALDQIERRRLSRQSQARGMVQAFAAEQASVVEMMSYIVACEHPAEVEQVRLILANMASDRRRAAHVLEQIKVAERAISQLWLIRFKQEQPS